MQQLLALTQPVQQDVAYVRERRPEMLTNLQPPSATATAAVASAAAARTAGSSPSPSRGRKGKSPARARGASHVNEEMAPFGHSVGGLGLIGAGTGAESKNVQLGSPRRVMLPSGKGVCVPASSTCSTAPNRTADCVSEFVLLRSCPVLQSATTRFA